MKFRDEYRSLCMAEAIDLMRQEAGMKTDRRDRYARRKAKRGRDLRQGER